ncbi:transposase [Paenibacillus lautus]
MGAKASADACPESICPLRYAVQIAYFRRKETVEERHALSVQRMVEPESVFGQIKNNRGFRRFLLRGLHKVSLEVGWLSLAHNLLKKAANDHNRSHSGVGITS